MSGGENKWTEDEPPLAQILGPVPPAMMVKHPGRPEIKPLPKRFYKEVTVGPAGGAGFPVLLDGRGVKTPKKAPLSLPVHALAEAVAAEWQAQTDRINPNRMPLTRLVNTAIDGVIGREMDVRADIVSYAGSDLVCYRAERPEGLVCRQAELWDPVLDWAQGQFGVTFRIASGLMPISQAPHVAEALAARLAHLEAFQLTALHVMTTLMGSTILSLAVLECHLTPDAAWTAAHVDEDWQIAQWGGDGEAETRRALRWTEMAAAARVLDCLR